MFEAVKLKGSALKHAAPEHQSDREVVLAAMKQNRSAYQFAAPEPMLKADREIMLMLAEQRETGPFRPSGLGFLSFPAFSSLRRQSTRRNVSYSKP